MNAALLPNIARFARIFAAKHSPSSTPADLTELGLCPDRMGTHCHVHGCARFLDEAPLVPRGSTDGGLDGIKQRRFPNSWTAIASGERTRMFRRVNRGRTVAVRYCPECRDSAQAWLDTQLLTDI